MNFYSREKTEVKRQWHMDKEGEIGSQYSRSMSIPKAFCLEDTPPASPTSAKENKFNTKFFFLSFQDFHQIFHHMQSHITSFIIHFRHLSSPLSPFLLEPPTNCPEMCCCASTMLSAPYSALCRSMACAFFS